MVQLRSFLVAGTLFTLALAKAGILEGESSPFDTVGIKRNEQGFGSEAIAKNEALAALAPPSQLGKKNNSMPLIQDRSLELVNRQSCDAGYWYCPAFGKCCPRTTNCCGYGYCIDPNDRCCPGGSCTDGWYCCGSNCSPPDGDCCSDGNYCEAGNICVKLYSSGRIVCCTDLECTAAVVSGSTSMMTSSADDLPSITSMGDIPSITEPPLTTEVVSVGDSYTTWYWTVTWWYLSFYWSTFQTESTVTYTTEYVTTTFTTFASDEFEASSLFSALSATLTLDVPSNAQTSLASLLNVEPSETEAPSFADNFDNFGTTRGPSSTVEAESSSTTTSRAAVATQNPAGPNGPGPGASYAASNSLVSWCLMALGGGAGVLMVVLHTFAEVCHDQYKETGAVAEASLPQPGRTKSPAKVANVAQDAESVG
ncbi:hypothetical protein EJ04DRAFT_556419 [Polyplosphaeria fusca]|uniref:Uncharacterized protein n=1 Tax=Polyplosphaeria fusca TaxID=682080 RepID=A0A9P4UY79_9PLEO|nr:hypothetical protein EJ04DRAFT_556419 [Polyplosphaeria fusca]